jgi:steroid 5-alpha reductase family enzyme
MAKAYYSADAYKLAACNLPNMVGFLTSSDARSRLIFLRCSLGYNKTMKNTKVVYQFNFKKLFKLQKTHCVLIVKVSFLIFLMEIIACLSVGHPTMFSSMKSGQNFGSVDVISLSVKIYTFILFGILS